MKLPFLLTSTFTDDPRTSTVQLCKYRKTFRGHVDRHAQIVKELNQRDEDDRIQDRETSKRSLQSGEPTTTVSWRYGGRVELFRKRARLVDPFKEVRTRKEVDFLWSRVAVSVRLPMIFFYNEEVHKSGLMTSECTENKLHQDQTWWCQVSETTGVTPHPFHYQTLLSDWSTTFFTTKLVSLPTLLTTKLFKILVTQWECIFTVEKLCQSITGEKLLFIVIRNTRFLVGCLLL